MCLVKRQHVNAIECRIINELHANPHHEYTPSDSLKPEMIFTRSNFLNSLWKGKCGMQGVHNRVDRIERFIRTVKLQRPSVRGLIPVIIIVEQGRGFPD